MCQYFYWKCGTCSAIQDHVVRCHFGVIHTPCQQIQQATLLPLIVPPPTCQACGEVRNTRSPFFSPPRGTRDLRPQDQLDPTLKAILNDRLFWRDPSLRLPFFEQTLAKYNDARKDIFDSSDAKAQVSNETAGCLNERNTQDDHLTAAWCRLRDSVLGRSSTRSAEDRSDHAKTTVEG